MSTRDTVSLSAREQQAFSALQNECEQSDPGFASRLRRGAGGVTRAAAAVARFLGAHRWAGPLLVVIGALIMLATVATATWAAVMGSLVMTAGLYGIGLGRHRARRPSRLLARLPRPTR
jgi:hypothetical protein